MPRVVGRIARWLGRWMRRWGVTLPFLLIFALWIVTHAWPAIFGSCHEVPLNIGSKGSVRECEAYPTADFLVLLAIVHIPILVLGGGDLKFEIPGIAKVERTLAREGKEAGQVAREEVPTVDERVEKYLERLPSPEELAPEGPATGGPKG